MSKSLTGRNALSYKGVNAVKPPDFYIYDNAPTVSDYKNFYIGDLWLQKGTTNVWVLVSRSNRIADWVSITQEGSGEFDSIKVDPGDIEVVAGDINVDAGDVNITLGTLNLAAVSEGVAYIDSNHDIISLGRDDDKHVLVGVTGGEPDWRELTSTGGTVTITQSATAINFEAGGAVATSSYSTDDGNVVSPTAGGNVVVAGGTNIGTTGAIANTITINLDDDVTLAGDLTLTSGTVYFSGLSEGVPYIDSTNDIISLGRDDDLHVLTGVTGADPDWREIASAGSSITVTQTASTINLEVVGGIPASTFTMDDTNTITPTAGGDVTVAGGSNISTAGTVANTITINLDDNVTITGDLHADNIVADTGDITASAGDIVTGVGNIESAGNVTAGTGVSVTLGDIVTLNGDIQTFVGDIITSVGDITASSGNMSASGSIDAGTSMSTGTTMTVGTDLILSGLSEGVLLSDATGNITSSAGTNSYVLTSNGAGAVPTWQASGGGGCSELDINEQSGATYTLVLTDECKEIRFTSAAVVAVTIPTNAAVAFPIGAQIILVQYGVGAVTISPDGGVTMNSASGYDTLYEQYSAAALIKQDTNEWLLAGDIR